MKQVVIAVTLGVLMCGTSYAADRNIEMSTAPMEAELGESIVFQCNGVGDWRRRYDQQQLT